jgi:hypothetical protein
MGTTSLRMVLVLVCILPCVSSIRAQSANARIGCYRVDSLRIGHFARTIYDSTLRFRLFNERRQSLDGSPLRVHAWLTSDSTSSSNMERFSGWDWRAPDSVYVHISDGNSGWRFEFAGKGDTLIGRGILLVGDFIGGPPPTGPVRALRTPCRP